VVGHASNFAPIKQTYHFPELAKHLKNKNKLDNIYFLMCGKGGDLSKIKRQVKKLGVSSHFKFLGKVKQKDMRDAYNAMDIFMLPSKLEGGPLSILEAMACEIPIVATRVGGIPSTMGRKAGYLFNSGDIKRLAKIIKKLQSNKELTKEMGIKGKERILNEHSVENVMKKYYRIYYSLANCKKKK